VSTPKDVEEAEAKLKSIPEGRTKAVFLVAEGSARSLAEGALWNLGVKTVFPMTWASVLSDGEPFVDNVIAQGPGVRDAIKTGLKAGNVRFPLISAGEETWRARDRRFSR